MSGRSSLQLKKQILQLLSSGKPQTYAELERRVNSNWQTIRTQCKELEIFGCIKITRKKEHPKNKKPFYEITITKQGLNTLKKM